MRNLKRVLSLALALVMMLGMMIITSSAASAKVDFADADEITNNEAVDVMVALGVLEGDGTNFNPNDILTREQAAKIICAMLIGPDNAVKLTGQTNFTDVPADRWSAPYISYCANVGIIAGNGDGTFGPEDKLTSLAFGKMLLVALGYDAEMEGYVNNANWATNIGSDMITAGVDVKSVPLSAALTRDQAAQMAFQTLQCTMVEYKNNSTITVGDITIQSNPTATNIAQTGYIDEYGKTSSLEFSEKYFADLHNNGAHDDFGRPATQWSLKSEIIGTYGKTANKTYTAGVGGTTTAAKLANMGITGFTLNSGSVTPVINGKDGTPVTALSGVPTLTGNGVVVELFFDNDTPTQINNIVITNTELVQVTSKSTARVNLTSKNSAVTGALTVNSTEDIFADVDAFAVDDYALVVPLWNADTSKYDVYSITDVETVVGKITDTTRNAANTANTANTAIAVAGTSYKAAATADASVTGATVNPNKESTVWLDAYGYAVYAKTAPGAVNSYVYILKTYNTLKDGVITPMAKVVKTNGEIADIQTDTDYACTDTLKQISSVSNGVYTLAAMGTAVSGASGADTANTSDTNVWQIGTSSNYAGFIALTAADEIKASDKKLTVDNAGDGTDGWTNYYGSSVKFVYVDTTNHTATVKDGVQKVATIPTTAYAILETNSSADATLVVKMVILEDTVSTSAEAADIIYLNSNKVASNTTMHNVSTDKDVAVPGYTVYKNGEKSTMYISGGASVGQGFFTYAESESIPGSYVIAAYGATTGAAAQKVNKTATGVFDGRMITADSVTVDLTAATSITDLRSPADQVSMPIVLTAAGLCEAYDTYNGLTLSFIYDADKGDAKIVYVLDEGTGYTISHGTDYTDGDSVKYIASATASAFAGDTVTVTVTTADNTVGGTAVSVDVKNGSDVLGTVTFEAGATAGTTKTFTFTMPAANVTLDTAAST